MLYACVAGFDMTGNLENFLDFGGTKQGLKLRRNRCKKISSWRELADNLLCIYTENRSRPFAAFSHE
jgi:hypothetical protein